MSDSNWEVEKAKLDAAVFQFTQLVGGALVAWQNVEAELYNLYMHVCQPGNSLSNSIIWHSINGLEIKVGITDALIQQYVKDPAILAKWTTAHKHIQKRKRLRDKFVHWNLIGDMNGGVYRGIYLTRPRTDIRDFINQVDTFSPSEGAMQMENVAEHIEAFHRLRLEIREIYFALLPLPPKSPESAQLPQASLPARGG